jgi:predicted Zn-dependent protease
VIAPTFATAILLTLVGVGLQPGTTHAGPPAQPANKSTRGASAKSGGVASASAPQPDVPPSEILVVRPLAEGSELAALAGELRRGVEGLRIDNRPAPYWGEIRVSRIERWTVEAAYGGVITDLVEREAIATINLRVGSRERDNGDWLGGLSEVTVSIPLTPDAIVSRRKVWLALDQAYRASIAALEAKSAAIARLESPPTAASRGAAPGARTEVSWSELASPETPISDPPIERLEVDRTGLRQLAAKISALHGKHPRLDDGVVSLMIQRTVMTSITTDGVVLGDVHDSAALTVDAHGRAPDGVELDAGGGLHFRNVPTVAALEGPAMALAEQVLAELEQLIDAPVIDEDYDGPVLLKGIAAAQFLASTLATQASGTPAPLSDGGRVVEMEPMLLSRLGKAIMPEFIDVVDDPAMGRFGDVEVDAEGHRARRIELVRRGVLSNLLMTSVPNDVVRESNGRARATPIHSVASSITNLVLSSRVAGLDDAALERELVSRARDDGWEFAYVIESLRDGTVLGPVGRSGASLYGNDRQVELSIPQRIVRVGVDGSRTLVRGALLSPTPMRVLRRIRKVGKVGETFELRLPPGRDGGFAADLGRGALLSDTVDVSITTPSLLLDGLEIVVERGDTEKPPTLTHPLRR